MQPKVNIFNYLQTEKLRLNREGALLRFYDCKFNLKNREKRFILQLNDRLLVFQKQRQPVKAAVVILLSNKSASHFFDIDFTENPVSKFL